MSKDAVLIILLCQATILMVVAEKAIVVSYCACSAHVMCSILLTVHTVGKQVQASLTWTHHTDSSDPVISVNVTPCKHSD